MKLSKLSQNLSLSCQKPLWMGLLVGGLLVACLQSRTSAESTPQIPNNVQVAAANPASTTMSSTGLPTLAGLVKKLRKSVVNIQTTWSKNLLGAPFTGLRCFVIQYFVPIHPWRSQATGIAG